MKQTVKKLFTALLIFAFALAAMPALSESNPAKPILVTAYRQMGWGDAVQIGYIDDIGNMWYLEGFDHDLNWPYELSEQLAWLASAEGFVSLGAIENGDLSELRSLVESAEDQGADCAEAANDAGTELSYAVRYSGDDVQFVMLGVSGDSRFENTDANAQALYAYLRGAFPDVSSYFGNTGMGPAGFQPLPLMDFCGYGGLELSGLRVTRTEIDCEASTEPTELTSDEAEKLIEYINEKGVMGKRGCIITTGGSTVYAFYDGETPVAVFEFCNGYLVMRDGTYIIGTLN